MGHLSAYLVFLFLILFKILLIMLLYFKSDFECRTLNSNKEFLYCCIAKKTNTIDTPPKNVN